MTHEDEARRIATKFTVLANEAEITLEGCIAAALAASERAGWIAGRDAAADAEEKHHGCEPCGCDATPGAIARALLPAAVAPKECVHSYDDPMGGPSHCRLCGKIEPRFAEPAAKCARCRGSKWVRDVRLIANGLGGTCTLSESVPCPACAGGGA